MENANAQLSTKLFSEAFERCFGHAINTALTESESKHFSGAVYESTGLVVGWKSLKSYSRCIIDESATVGDQPSKELMDSLARYVMRAPKTSEVERKKERRRHPYWREYENQLLRGTGRGAAMKLSKKKFFTRNKLIATGILLLGIVAGLTFRLHLL